MKTVDCDFKDCPTPKIILTEEDDTIIINSIESETLKFLKDFEDKIESLDTKQIRGLMNEFRSSLEQRIMENTSSKGNYSIYFCDTGHPKVVYTNKKE